MPDEFTRLRERLARLRVLTESPKGVSFDFIKNYAIRAASRGREYYRIKAEVHTPRRHNLVEELALTSQFLSRCQNVLQSWEIELLQKYESSSDGEVLGWIRSEWKEDWSEKELRREMVRIKRRLGAHNERLVSRALPKKSEKPRFLEMIKDTLKGVKEKYENPR